MFNAAAFFVVLIAGCVLLGIAAAALVPSPGWAVLVAAPAGFAWGIALQLVWSWDS